MTHYTIIDGEGLVIGAGRNDNALDALASAVGIGTVRLGDTGQVGQWFDGTDYHDLPPRPGPWARWQGGEWVDPRTPADLQASLYAVREATMRDKSDLLMALVQMRLMEAADARVAARGDIPEVYQDAFSQLPQEAQDYAMIKWPSDQVISRMNPIALLFAFVAEIDDDQLDAAFGVQIPT